MTEQEKDELVARSIVANCPPNRWVDFVAQFHEEKQPHHSLPKIPTSPTFKEALIEVASLQSELSELITAMSHGDLVEVVDGAVDAIYVLIGLCLKYGVDPTPHMEEVQRSNMDKIPAGPGTLGRKTVDGKSCKPEGWVSPHIKDLLIAQGWKE